jgi:DNA repair exonuclease SbcCD nuclease subunit
MSDLHIEAPSDVASLGAIAALARGRDAQVVLIVGDLFDHNRVADEVIAATLDELAAIAARVVVLPGNHDPYLSGSVYVRADFAAKGIAVFRRPGGESIELPGLDLSIWGCAHTSYDDFRPLATLPPRGNSAWDIALAHGHLVLGPADARRAYLITPEEIAASDRDYVALGHWDLPRDVSVDGVAAAYSGSPSRVGRYALVALDTDPDGTRRTTIELAAMAEQSQIQG